METNRNSGSELTLRWIYIAWLSLAFTLLVFMVCGVIEQGDPTQLIERVVGDTAMFAMGVYVVGLLIAVSFLFVLLRRRGLDRRSIGLKGNLTGRGILYAVLGWFVAFWLFYVVQQMTGHAGIRMFWNEGDFFRQDSLLHMAVILAGPIVIAPIAEEIIYRGYVLTALLRGCGTLSATALSALIFASVHIMMGPGLTIYIFIGAFIPAYLYIRFGNIYPCILMHFLNNVVVYLVIPRVFN